MDNNAITYWTLQKVLAHFVWTIHIDQMLIIQLYTSSYVHRVIKREYVWCLGVNGHCSYCIVSKLTCKMESLKGSI